MKTEKQENIQEEKVEGKKKKTKKGGKAKWIILALTPVLILIVLLGSYYVHVAESYRSRFLPVSMINGIDCSDMDAEEVSARLTPSVDDYVLVVKGRDYATGESGAVLGRITASDINMRYDGIQSSVEDILAQQDEYKWIFPYFTDQTASYSVATVMSYDEEKAKNFVQTWDAFQAKNMRESQDAYISAYSEQTNRYTVIPGTISTRLNSESAHQYIIAALNNFGAELDLEALGCYEEKTAEKDEAKLNDAVNTVNKWLSASVTYDWNGTKVVLDKEQLRDWISMVDDEPVLDTEAVKSFVKKQASAYDTYGKYGSFTTIHNVTFNLYRASYGWKTDINAETEALIQLIQEGSKADREPSYSVVARKKGTDDIGDSYVEIDLTHQHLYLHSDGEVVLETDFVSGDMTIPGRATPQGIFGVTYKQLNAVLRGEDYATPVSYWMPFYGDFGMHDAAWRRVFGGDVYIANGSHGCVNLPLDKAAVIFQYVSKGFPVICYYYEVDPLAGQEEAPTDPDLSVEGQGGSAGQSPIEGQGGNAGQNAGEAHSNVEELNNSDNQSNREENSGVESLSGQ